MQWYVIGSSNMVRLTASPGVPRGLGDNNGNTAGGNANSWGMVSRVLVLPAVAIVTPLALLTQIMSHSNFYRAFASVRRPAVRPVCVKNAPNFLPTIVLSLPLSLTTPIVVS